jgi:hypothetical protein
VTATSRPALAATGLLGVDRPAQRAGWWSCSGPVERRRSRFPSQLLPALGFEFVGDDEILFIAPPVLDPAGGYSRPLLVRPHIAVQ